jgi:tetratricopeptide (TPR) repeat protein
MVAKILKLIILLSILSVLLAIVTMNQQPVELKLLNSTPITAGLGVVAITLFFSGVLITALIGTLIRIPSYLREKSLENSQKNVSQFFTKFCEARTALLSKQYAKARVLWEQITKKDPSGVISFVELSKSLENSGEIREAIKVLAPAKSNHPENAEVLLRAAELNLALGNKTAAIDNYSLILSNQTNHYAAEQAMILSESIQRYDDALEYYAMIEGSSFAKGEDGIRLRLKVLVSTEFPNVEEKRKAIVQFQKKHPKFSDTYNYLAEVAEEESNHQEMLDLLIKGYQLSRSEIFLENLCIKALSAGKEDLAIQTLRKFLHSESGSSKLECGLFLAKLFLVKEKTEDCAQILGDIRIAVNHGRKNQQEEFWLLDSYTALLNDNRSLALSAIVNLFSTNDLLEKSKNISNINSTNQDTKNEGQGDATII